MHKWSLLGINIKYYIILFWYELGCWKQSGEQKCENTECVALQRSTKALNNTKFCCCHGDLCNLNITSSNLADLDNKIFNPLSSQKSQPSKITALIATINYYIVEYCIFTLF